MGLVGAVLAFKRRVIVVSAVINSRAHRSTGNGTTRAEKERAEQAAPDHGFGTRFHIDLAPDSGADADMALSPAELLRLRLKEMSTLV